MIRWVGSLRGKVLATTAPLSCGGNGGSNVDSKQLLNIDPCLYQLQQKRMFSRGGGGSRGARGHGWYMKYKTGEGGRHLQGEYHDRESPEVMEAWNDAVLALGSRRVYIDVVAESRRVQSLTFSKKFIEVPPLESLTGQKVRLEMDLATKVMPETTDNFIQLLNAPPGDGYVGTRLYRVEKNVGMYGGDVLTNTGKIGKAFFGDPMQMDIKKDPLVMWHIPGTVTMLVPTVGQIDSRFMMISHAAPHIDGIARAFGRLTPESLAIVADWVDTLITKFGIPTTFDFVVTEGGVLDSPSSKEITEKDDQHETTEAA